MRVILGLLVWTMAEISAFVVVGGWIGLVGVLAIVLGTGVAGVLILRGQGMRMAGVARGPEALKAAGRAGLMAFGALILILPGLLTDVVGLALMVPLVQTWVIARLGARVTVATQQGSGEIVEATAVEVMPDALKPPSGWTKQ